MEKPIPKRVAWAGAFVLATLVFVTYYPGLKIGFYLDDYLYLEQAGRIDWSNALAQFFDPSLQLAWYRPLQIIQFFWQFHLLGRNADGYHILQITHHAINVCLLYAIAWRLSRKWLIGWTSGFFYASFSVFPSAINWVGIIDPLASMFYLLSIWFWIAYLERNRWQYYALTLVSFVLALLSKQIGVTIPVTLFLIEMWLLRNPISVHRLIRRYALFGPGIVALLLVQYISPSTHTMVAVFGWQVGTRMAFILLQYLVLFFFPYATQPSIDVNQLSVGTPPSYGWMLLAMVLLAQVTWRTRSRALLFLCIFALLNLLPVLPIPFIEHRYLYLPLMAGAVMLALLLHQLSVRHGARRFLVGVAALALGFLVLGNGQSINASALATAESVSGLRVPFQQIEQQYPTLPKNTLLYFVDPITPTRGGLGGMAMLQYGPDVWVKDWIERAKFDSYDATHVFYFDDTFSLREIIGEKNVSTHLSPSLPVNFEAGIRLDGYEVPRTNARRGTPIVLVCYWRATQTIRQDYVLFAQLVSPSGEVVATYASAPRKGQLPTSTWELGRFTPDAILLPIDSHVPTGSGYHIEIGWHDGTTRQQVPIVNAQGHPIGDYLILESFVVEP